MSGLVVWSSLGLWWVVGGRVVVVVGEGRVVSSGQKGVDGNGARWRVVGASGGAGVVVVTVGVGGVIGGWWWWLEVGGHDRLNIFLSNGYC